MRDNLNNNDNSARTNGQNHDAYAQDEQKPALQISNLPAIILRRLWLIAIVIVLTLAAGVIYLRQATPYYRATTKLFVAASGGNRILGDNSELTPLTSGNRRGTQAEIVVSPLVLRRVADRPDIKAMKSFAGGDNTMAMLRVGLNVVVGNDDLMDISFDTQHYGEAAQVANAVADAYIAFSDEYKRNTSAEMLQIIQKEKQKVEDEMAQRLTLLTRFKMESGGLALASKDKDGKTVLQGSVTIQQLNSFTEAMTKAQIEVIEAKANLEGVINLKNDPNRLRQYVATQRSRGGLVSTNAGETRLTQELGDLYAARSQMESKLGIEHPRYVATIARIAMLEQELTKYDATFVDSQIAMSQENYKAAERRVQELATYIQANGEEAKKLNNQVAQYERMAGEMEQTRSRLDFLNARIRELGMNQDVRALNVMLVEAAVEPADPFSPNSGKVLKMSLAFGLVLGLCLAMMLELVDDRLRSSDQVASAMNLPILGVIPEVTDIKGEVARIMEREPNSAQAEAIRGLRTAVLFGMPEGRAKTIMVTSPMPGDGKSTIAACLAESLAQSGQRTILLDADMRKPRVEAIFELSREIGLSSVITGRGTLDSAIQKGPVENLDVIACGPIPPNPAELLNSDAFRKLLATLSERYDQVVIDTPPVLMVTDARVVSAITDVTIMVLLAGKSRQRQANHAKEALLSVGGRILGIVVNAVPNRGRGVYGHEYGYAYGEYAQAQKRA